jgi:hypothetical protein
MPSTFHRALGCLLLAGCGATRSGVDCGPGSVEIDGECAAEMSGGGTAGTDPAGGSGGQSSAGSGGLAQGGTSPVVCANPVPLTADDALIDDFETGVARWHCAADGTGTVAGTAFNGGPAQPNEGEIDGSTLAAHVQGSDMQMWGAVLSYQPWLTTCADLTSFSGVSFWARSASLTDTNLATVLIVEFPIPTTQMNTFNGDCEVGCWDHYEHLIELTDEWQQYTLEWSDFAQTGWGTPVSFTIERIQSITFSIAGAPGGLDFDFWIDDVALVPQ